MNESYTVQDAEWILVGGQWPSHQVRVLCKEDVGKHQESIEAYIEARKALKRAGLLFESESFSENFDLKLTLYDDGEQEPFLVFESYRRWPVSKVCVYVRSLTQENLSQLDMLKAVRTVTES